MLTELNQRPCVQDRISLHHWQPANKETIQFNYVSNINQCTDNVISCICLSSSFAFSCCLVSRFSVGFRDLLGPISRRPPYVEFHQRLDWQLPENLPIRAHHLWSVFLPQLSSQPNLVQPNVYTLQRNVQGGHVSPASSHQSQETLA